MPAIARSADGRVVAIGSRDLARAEAAAAELAASVGQAAAPEPVDEAEVADDKSSSVHGPSSAGAGIRAYQGYQAVIDDPAVDAVYIALPNHLHREWTVAAARAGKHVLCEKPLALDSVEGAKMVEAAAAAGVNFAEAIMYRYHPRMIHLLDLLRGGVIGEVRHVQAAFSFTMIGPDNYRARAEFGGGALLDVGSYGVSAVRWIADAEPEGVMALGRFEASSGIDLQLDGLLDFPSGATAHVFCGFTAAKHQNLTVVGSQGVITVPLAFTAWRDDPAPIILRRGSSVETIDIPPTDPYFEMVAHFQACVRGLAELRHPATDGLANLRVLDALRQSAQTGRHEPVRQG